MSLQVWLPLIKDLTNYGLANVTVTSNAVTQSTTEGKLGTSYSFNGTTTWIKTTMPSTMKSLKNSSVCMWIKNTSSVGAGGGIMHNDSNAYACMCLYTSGWQMATGSAWKYISTGTFANTSAWHHIVCTMDDTTIRTYFDGALITETTIAAQSVLTDITDKNFIGLGCDFPGGDEYFTGFINDFRVYDHALSPKEVKEISKGLVCHYSLDNNGSGMPNLLKNTNKGISGWGWSSSGGSRTVTALSDGIGVRLESVTAGTSWSVLGYQDGNLKNTITAGVSYTVSVDCRCSYVTTLNCTILDGNGQNSMTNNVSANRSTVAGQWVHLVWKLTANSSFTVSSQEIYITNASLTAGTYFEFKNIKMEEGTTDTPWCPNASDDSYSIFNINGNKEIDISGYSNHGTKSGTIIYNSDTPRYSVATVFDGTSSGIEIQSSVFPVVLNRPFTVSMWVYDQETGGRSIFFGNYSLTGSFFNIEKEGSNKARFYWNANPDFHCTNSPIAANAWTHLVMTRDSNTVKCYINGTLTDTSTTTLSGTIPTNATIFRLGRDGRSDATMFKGRMSDFRLYATALSADDVKQLYQTSASIDNNGNVFCSDIQEV